MTSLVMFTLLAIEAWQIHQVLRFGRGVERSRHCELGRTSGLFPSMTTRDPHADA